MKEFPDTIVFRNSPCLRSASTLDMRIISIQNLGKLRNTAVIHNQRTRGQQGTGCPASGFAVDHVISLAVSGKLPGPGSAVVIGGFPPRVFVTLISSPVGMHRIIQQDSGRTVNRKRIIRLLVRQTADRSGNQKFGTGIQNQHRTAVIPERAESQGIKLIRAQMIVRNRF